MDYINSVTNFFKKIEPVSTLVASVALFVAVSWLEITGTERVTLLTISGIVFVIGIGRSLSIIERKWLGHIRKKNMLNTAMKRLQNLQASEKDLLLTIHCHRNRVFHQDPGNMTVRSLQNQEIIKLVVSYDMQTNYSVAPPFEDLVFDEEFLNHLYQGNSTPTVPREQAQSMKKP